MSRPLTAADRSALIKLASTLPKGSPERKTILAGLSKIEKAVQHSRLMALKRDLEKIERAVFDLADFRDTGLPPKVDHAVHQFVAALLDLNIAISRGR